ncbi:MAG: hypothetical protein LBK27_05320 [Treponema sp.]|nr:hypothetical protein [Treponema sp.]
MNRFVCVLLLTLTLTLGLCAALFAQASEPADEALPEPVVQAVKPASSFFFQGDSRFWSLGAAAGSSFAAPWFTGTIQGTVSPFPYTLVELGCDFGFVHGYRNEAGLGYFSLYPFAHLNGYIPLMSLGGLYVGAGGGVMLAFYSYEGENKPYAVPAFDVTTGLYAGKGSHYATAAYTLRTNFGQVNHKVSLGYSYRFGVKEGNNE